MQQRAIAADHQPDSFGTLLKQWRNQRGFSQLNLAITSQVSQRHISFLESGRAKPSREMVLQLATVLEIPLRQQNLMLTVAGFAPIHAAQARSSGVTVLLDDRYIRYALRYHPSGIAN
jgi:transcriptional regulator with XRE-family HTH domain